MLDVDDALSPPRPPSASLSHVVLLATLPHTTSRSAHATYIHIRLPHEDFTREEPMTREPSSCDFPGGCMYSSGGGAPMEEPGEEGYVVTGNSVPGRVLSFVPGSGLRFRAIRAVNRMDEAGRIHGCVFRVASERILPGGGGDDGKEEIKLLKG